MVGVGEIAGLLSSLKAAKDIAQSMVGLRDTAAFQAKAIEFQSKILDAQNAAFAAQEERSTLIEPVIHGNPRRLLSSTPFQSSAGECLFSYGRNPPQWPK